MTSVEIEDVLSSIRRLVVEGLRPVQPVAAEPGGGDKLILTPALRVVQGEDGPLIPPDEISTSQLRAVLEGAVTAAPRATTYADDLALADADDDAPLPHPAEASAEPLPAPQAEDNSIGAVVAVVGAGVPDGDWEAEVEVRARPAAPDWSAIVEDTPAAPQAAAAPNAPSAVAPSTNARRAPDLLVFSSARDHEVSAWKGDEDWDEEAGDATGAGPLLDEDSLGQRAEAAAVAEIERMATRFHFEDAAHPRGAEAPRAAPGTDAAPDDDDALSLDEEALRDMVRDIIREELLGGLGERITRNVRKLVRMEINRALATRDLD